MDDQLDLRDLAFGRTRAERFERLQVLIELLKSSGEPFFSMALGDTERSRLQEILRAEYHLTFDLLWPQGRKE